MPSAIAAGVVGVVGGSVIEGRADVNEAFVKFDDREKERIKSKKTLLYRCTYYRKIRVRLSVGT
ncbi:hypothetical protein AGMMS50229_18570 [Campylobacterota bacterium]|nr:hypothetical protein AGMMS50229_18570 [Campylobacterota bacterium]